MTYLYALIKQQVMKKRIRILLLSVLMLVLSSFVLLYGQSDKKPLKTSNNKAKTEKVVKTRISKYKNLKSYTKYKASRIYYISKRKKIKLV